MEPKKTIAGMDEHRLMLEKTRRLATTCVSMRFEGASILNGMKVGRLMALYDGMGPNWSHKVIAEIIEHLDLCFEPAAFLLDVQYRVNEDRNDESFHLCNLQFYHNCCLLAKSSYGWWRPRRYSLLKSAKALYDACEMYGMASWRNRGASTGC